MRDLGNHQEQDLSMFITLVPHLNSTGQAESSLFGPASNIQGRAEDSSARERWTWLSGTHDESWSGSRDFPTNLRWDIGPRMTP